MDLRVSFVQHFSHQHPLISIQHHNIATEEEASRCFGCWKVVDGPGPSPGYGCKQCKYFLHKRCAELELVPHLDHPFHPQHLLTLLPKAPFEGGGYRCNFCGRSSSGFVYHCGPCQFDLHINCALLHSSVASNFPTSIHHHPLFFIQNHDQDVKYDCSACQKPLSGPIYHCSDCSDPSFNLHKQCAELPLEINQPFHSEHLLTLLPKSPYDCRCYFCTKSTVPGFVYHCDTCDLYMHINCALLHSSIATNFPNSLHHHQLFFIQNHNQEIQYDCSGCDKPLSGPIYRCLNCHPEFFMLHKQCAELPLEINHPFHPQHLLILLLESLPTEHPCIFCNRNVRGLVYHCALCDINLHLNCSLLQSSIVVNFPFHDHPLIFMQEHDKEIGYDCNGCMKPLSGPIYNCTNCPDYHLHKECAELPLEINHPFDRKHPLTLLPKPPTHPDKCSCYLCKIQWTGFVYSCSVCKFEFTHEDISAPPSIKNASHEQPWTLISRQMSFICDFCGTSGDRTPYLSATCELLVHKNCISLPHKILITRHHHVISHSYSIRQIQLEERICRICYDEVDTRYGSYCCSYSDCNYIAHVHCATDRFIWDGKSIPEDYDERSMEALDESLTLITNYVFQHMSIGEKMVATEIKHAFHDHNLRLISSGEIIDDSQCGGCMKPISTPFYSCDKCRIFLHKACAELPRQKRHPFHKHALRLISSIPWHDPLKCYACQRPYDGFSYQCDHKDCGSYVNFDIGCILLSETLKHPSHDQHSLFLVHGYPEECSGCLSGNNLRGLAYKCVKRCDFTLDLQCATLPLAASYKYDRHSLALSYRDDPNPSQHYCDLCENKRDPRDWFYSCVDCDNSLHEACAIGELPCVKLGRKFELDCHRRHRLTVVKNIWNCPPCNYCGELCNGQALECKKCNFIVHVHCIRLPYLEHY